MVHEVPLYSSTQVVVEPPTSLPPNANAECCVPAPATPDLAVDIGLFDPHDIPSYSSVQDTTLNVLIES